ncbi:AbiTii domain-containing protein [Streptomyces sp. NPDC001107]
MTPEEHSHALELADELLADIELSRLPLDALLLKGARLARLTYDDEFAEWVSFELNGYPASAFNGKYWLLTGRRSNKNEADYVGAARLSVYVSTLEEELKNMKLPSGSGDYGVIAVRETRTHIAGVRNTVLEHQAILSAVKGVLHSFVSKHFYLLRFSTHQGELFDVAKSNIDRVLAGVPGEALRKIDSAYTNIRAGDPESIAGAMNSVRRLIDAVADAVFPATDQTRTDGQGNTIKLGDQQRLNRIKAHIDDHTDRKSRGDRLKRAVSDIYGRVSTGVHSDVAASEAMYLFLSSYVLLGEIVSLPDPVASQG